MLNIVQTIRQKYPTPLGQTHGAFLLEVARATGKGLLKKDWGTFVRLPDGTGVSQDCLMERNGVHYDILADGEGRAEPRWDVVVKEGTQDPLIVDPNRYYDAGDVPIPDHASLDGLVREMIAAAVAPLEKRIAELELRKPPSTQPADLSGVVRYGDSVTLTTTSGAVIAVKDGDRIGPDSEPIKLETRPTGTAGSFERLRVGKA